MSRNNEVLLSSTLHDPKGVFLPTLEAAAGVILENYSHWIINTTAITDPRVKEGIKALGSKGIYFSETDPTKPIVTDRVENDHLYLLGKTLDLAQDLGIERVQYTDGDRMLMAGHYYPKDLEFMATEAGKTGKSNSFLNFRRSPTDYLAHHPPLVETELVFARIYSRVFGMPVDVGSTSHVMSRDVLGAVIRRSPQMEPVSFPHPKWLIIAREMGANINSIETNNVLTFETPEQFKAEVEQTIQDGAIDKYVLSGDGQAISTLTVDDLKNYDLTQQVYMATLGRASTVNPKEWELRFNTVSQYLSLLKRHLDLFDFDQDQKAEFDLEIEKALISSNGRKEVILKALEK